MAVHKNLLPVILYSALAKAPTEGGKPGSPKPVGLFITFYKIDLNI